MDLFIVEPSPDVNNLLRPCKGPTYEYSMYTRTAARRRTVSTPYVHPRTRPYVPNAAGAVHLALPAAGGTQDGWAVPAFGGGEERGGAQFSRAIPTLRVALRSDAQRRHGAERGCVTW